MKNKKHVKPWLCKNYSSGSRVAISSSEKNGYLSKILLIAGVVTFTGWEVMTCTATSLVVEQKLSVSQFELINLN